MSERVTTLLRDGSVLPQAVVQAIYADLVARDTRVIHVPATPDEKQWLSLARARQGSE